MVWMNFADDGMNAPPSNSAATDASTTGAGAPPPAPPRGTSLSSPQPPEDYSPEDDNNDLIMTLLSWGIAITFHLGVLMLAFFISWSVTVDVDEEEVIIPDARLSATPGAPLTQRQTQSLTRTTSTTMRSLSAASSRTTSTSPAQLSGKVDFSSISIGAAGGAQGGGASDPLGEGIQAAAGMKATMYGSGGNARRIVYMIDASGSLIGIFPNVIAELKRSIGQLSDKQEFTVIFFQGDEAKEVPPAGMKRATVENKSRVISWIDTGSGNIVPMQLSNPVKAVTLALHYRPQLMFLLSDNITGEGRYQVDQRKLLADIKAANRANTKINTFQFLYPDPLIRAGLRGTMELISEDSGGIYKYLDGRELEIE